MITVSSRISLMRYLPLQLEGKVPQGFHSRLKLFQNERGLVFSQLPDAGSSNLRVLHTLFSGNTQADAVVEMGDAAAMASRVLSPTEGRHQNRSDRKDPDANGIDVFTGDGQRGVVTTFRSTDPINSEYLKPATADLNVASPTGGAKGYVGAVAP